MNLQVRPVAAGDFTAAHALQREYLDNETLDAFRQRVRDGADLYWVAVDGERLVGVCYGRPDPRDRSAVQLHGIAVNLDAARGYARRGIGSRMLAAFAGACRARDCIRISVGSADDRGVEDFYRKNGFHPEQLVVKGAQGQELERATIGAGVSGEMERMRLRRKYGSQAREVIFIFGKDI